MFISTTFVFLADAGLTFHAVLHVLSCATFVPLLSMATSSAKSKSCIVSFFIQMSLFFLQLKLFSLASLLQFQTTVINSSNYVKPKGLTFCSEAALAAFIIISCRQIGDIPHSDMIFYNFCRSRLASAF